MTPHILGSTHLCFDSVGYTPIYPNPPPLRRLLRRRESYKLPSCVHYHIIIIWCVRWSYYWVLAAVDVGCCVRTEAARQPVS